MQDNKKSIWAMFSRFSLLTIGSLVYALGISLLINPNSLAPGGVSGIAIVINRIISEYANIGVGTLILLINIPLLIICFFRFKLAFTISTVYSTVLTSVAVDFIEVYFEPYIPLTNNKMLAAIIGGAVIAIGIGLVFHGNACTGGTDIIVKILRQKFKQFKSGILFAITDAIIIIFSASIFGIESALYAVICIFVTSFVLDFVLYGPESAKIIYIISDVPDNISQRILTELDTGVTFLDGQGGYSGIKRKVLMCVFRKHLYKRVRDIVVAEDPNAFMIVSSAHEVFGEGFKNPFADEL